MRSGKIRRERQQAGMPDKAEDLHTQRQKSADVNRAEETQKEKTRERMALGFERLSP